MTSDQKEKIVHYLLMGWVFGTINVMLPVALSETYPTSGGNVYAWFHNNGGPQCRLAVMIRWMGSDNAHVSCTHSGGGFRFSLFRCPVMMPMGIIFDCQATYC